MHAAAVARGEHFQESGGIDSEALLQPAPFPGGLGRQAVVEAEAPERGFGGEGPRGGRHAAPAQRLDGSEVASVVTPGELYTVELLRALVAGRGVAPRRGGVGSCRALGVGPSGEHGVVRIPVVTLQAGAQHPGRFGIAAAFEDPRAPVQRARHQGRAGMLGFENTEQLQGAAPVDAPQGAEGLAESRIVAEGALREQLLHGGVRLRRGGEVVGDLLPPAHLVERGVGVRFGGEASRQFAVARHDAGFVAESTASTAAAAQHLGAPKVCRGCARHGQRERRDNRWPSPAGANFPPPRPTPRPPGAASAGRCGRAPAGVGAPVPHVGCGPRSAPAADRPRHRVVQRHSLPLSAARRTPIPPVPAWQRGDRGASAVPAPCRRCATPHGRAAGARGRCGRRCARLRRAAAPRPASAPGHRGRSTPDPR